jgi:hypothetical protein
MGLVGWVSYWGLYRRGDPVDPQSQVSSDLPGWTIAAWLAGLLVLVPLYTPYPRLALPLMCGAWLASSVLAATLPKRQVIFPTYTFPWYGIVVLAIAAQLAFVITRNGPQSWLPEVAWQDRRGLESLAASIVDAAAARRNPKTSAGRDQLQGALYVFAEPALFFHLAALPPRPEFRFLPQPIGDHALLAGPHPHPEVATFLIAGPHAAAVPSDAAQFAAAESQGRLELVAKFPDDPSDLVLLDQAKPGELDALRMQEIRLYRVR